MKKIFFLFLIFGAFFVIVSPVQAEKLIRSVKFEEPDIKNQFCGARIDFKICKCAFHGEYCKDMGRSKSRANDILQFKYGAYVALERSKFVASCVAAGGVFDDDICQYFEATPKEKQCLPADFEQAWKKYSDMDDTIPVNERSYEAKQHFEKLTKVVENTKEIFLLERDMEIDRQARLALKEYKTALVNNIKTNLLKAFWRLAWITYDNIQSGRASGGTFEKMYDLPSLGEGMAAYLKTVRSVTPGDSVIAINTENLSGKVKNVGLSVALDALESVGDPVAVATTLISESVKQTFGLADITQEEIKILEEQHLKNRLLDDIVQESYRQNRERRLRVMALKADNEILKMEMNDLENKERERVRENIVDSCK
ncbi:MAG TPA: hypothetical protein VJH89_00140 [Patescibacteria group bacterium]|nr:hypothetical protein [Patescibacteria group bacterium]